MNIEKIISAFIHNNSGIPGSKITGKFNTAAESRTDICRSINSAFIIYEFKSQPVAEFKIPVMWMFFNAG